MHISTLYISLELFSGREDSFFSALYSSSTTICPLPSRVGIICLSLPLPISLQGVVCEKVLLSHSESIYVLPCWMPAVSRENPCSGWMEWAYWVAGIVQPHNANFSLRASFLPTMGLMVTGLNSYCFETYVLRIMWFPIKVWCKPGAAKYCVCLVKTCFYFENVYH